MPEKNFLTMQWPSLKAKNDEISIKSLVGLLSCDNFVNPSPSLVCLRYTKKIDAQTDLCRETQRHIRKKLNTPYIISRKIERTSLLHNFNNFRASIISTSTWATSSSRQIDSDNDDRNGGTDADKISSVEIENKLLFVGPFPRDESDPNGTDWTTTTTAFPSLVFHSSKESGIKSKRFGRRKEDKRSRRRRRHHVPLGFKSITGNFKKESML